MIAGPRPGEIIITKLANQQPAGLGDDQSEAAILTLDVQDVSVLAADVRILRVGGPEVSDHYDEEDGHYLMIIIMRGSMTVMMIIINDEDRRSR